MPKPTQSKVEQGIEAFLFGLSLHGENYRDTPKRVGRMWKTFLSCPKPTFRTFPLQEKAGMIVLKDHVLWGFCPHHLLPVEYTVKLAYIPDKRVVGLSKLARVVDWVVSKVPLQEDIAPIVCKELREALEPKGTACIVQGKHMCMRIRGVRSCQAYVVTSNLTGAFLSEGTTRQEFMTL